MTTLIDFASALSTIYKYIYWEISEKDFIRLQEEPHIMLPIDGYAKTWYTINHFRLKQHHNLKFLVDEDRKTHILSATKLICTLSQALPTNASFRERLLYCKSFLPSCVYSDAEHIGL